MIEDEEMCVAGCDAFTGGEIMHNKACVFYPESFTKRYDDLLQRYQEKCLEVQQLEAEIRYYNSKKTVLDKI